MSTRDDTLMQLCAMPLHGMGTVLAVAEESGLCTVATLQGELRARPAASCLLVPHAGDRVWLAGDLEQGIYVTAILERGDPASQQRVCLPPNSTIEVRQGALTLRADTLRLAAGQQLSVQADAAALCVQKLTGVGREAVWSFGRIKVISELLESFAERLVQFSRWSQRTVDGMDQVRSRQIDYRADETLQLQAENLVANAANLVKLDGEQIHLG
jgi:hypothetical protein